jgi:anti-sigma regulatory factor (Ser/Thr protein kinase)
VDVAAGHGASSAAQQVIALLTSELVTNAVKYGPGDADVEVDVSRGDGTVRIAVTDDGEELPAVLDPPPTAAGGRGMRLVGMLADDWGVAPRAGGGKTVWFEVRVAGGA